LHGRRANPEELSSPPLFRRDGKKV
jgi:hypothetical protein